MYFVLFFKITNSAINKFRWKTKAQFLSQRSYEIATENYFCNRHKNRRKRKQRFKLSYFMIRLHFRTSN